MNTSPLPSNDEQATGSPVKEHVSVPSRRRTEAQHGYVKFPVGSADFHNSKEGGMFVKLVVLDDRDYDETPWTICCGTSITDYKTESLVGDDQAPVPAWISPAEGETPQETLRVLDEHTAAHRAWEERHYPAMNDEESGPEFRYITRTYRAVLLLGVTGWSGYDRKHEQYWHCTYQDLTPEGKQLYDQLKTLYAGCQLHLLTFLDT